MIMKCSLDYINFDGCQLIIFMLCTLQEKDQRSLDMDTAKAMLALLLGRNWSLFGTFHQFLEVKLHKLM